ncbi:MAG: integrase [Clostridium sp.]
MAVTIEKGDGNYIMISFSYDYDKVSAIKKIEGSRWNETKKAWIVPNTKKAINIISVDFCDEDIIFDSSIDLFDV